MIIFRHRRRLHKHIMLVRLHHHKVVQLFLNRLLYPHHLQVHVHLQRASLVEMTHDFRWQELHEAVRLTKIKKIRFKLFFQMDSQRQLGQIWVPQGSQFHCVLTTSK